MSSDPSAASAEDIAKQFVPVSVRAWSAMCGDGGLISSQTDISATIRTGPTVAVTLVSGATIGFAMVSQYKVLVTNSGNPGVWMTSPWEFVMTPVTTGLSAFLVQLFFASRIAFFRRDIIGRILSATVSLVGPFLVATLAFAGALADMAVYVKNGFNALDLSKIFMVARIWTISSVICDILIAATMTVLLVRSRRQTHFRSTKEMLQRLILQSIETGTVTAFVMVLMLICYETMSSKNSSYTVWELAIGPLYGNVMLFVLNAREGLSSDDVHCNTNDIELDSTPLPLSFASRRTDSQLVQISTVGGEVDITETAPDINVEANFEPVLNFRYLPKSGGRVHGGTRWLTARMQMLAGYASCLLYGYYLAQLHVYFNRHAHGDRWSKWLAISIAIISGLTIGFSMASQCVILVEHGGDPSVWSSSPWQLALGPLTTGFSAFLVQLFFASRIARLRRDAAALKNWYQLTVKVAAAALSSALAVTILGLSQGSHLMEIKSKSSTAIARLRQDYEQVHIDATRPRLRSLASTFIETGMILTVVMLLSVICYETMGARNSTYFICYGNVMLFILNSRQRATCEENTGDIELRSPPLSPGSPKMISHVLSIGAIDSKLSCGHGKTNDIVDAVRCGAEVATISDDSQDTRGVVVHAKSSSSATRCKREAVKFFVAQPLWQRLRPATLRAPMPPCINGPTDFRYSICVQSATSRDSPTRGSTSLISATVVVTAVAGIGTWFGVISQYLVLVRHSGNPDVWTSNPWQFLVTLGSTGLTALLVQLFFVSRIARFRRDIIGKIMATLITMVSILAFAGFLAIMVLYVKCGLNTLELETVLPKAVTRLWGVSSTICDVLIAAAMSYLLLTLSREYSIGPLYANVLLFVLNSRERIAADEVRCTTSDIELTTQSVERRSRIQKKTR
ncbi:hypothetical protein GGF50DRAFT_86176 [Schizophyllum commune]